MKQILIIDDDIHIGNMLEETLSKEGYKISRAYSGTEALLVLSQSKPDLILLDLMLPGLNGEDVLPKIKGIPVIIVSAKVDIDNTRQGAKSTPRSSQRPSSCREWTRQALGRTLTFMMPQKDSSQRPFCW